MHEELTAFILEFTSLSTEQMNHNHSYVPKKYLLTSTVNRTMTTKDSNPIILEFTLLKYLGEITDSEHLS